MKPAILFRNVLFAAALLFAAIGLQPAAAGPLDDLRAQGLVGERSDGYAEARSGASAKVKALVSRVNAKRKVLYEKRAKEQGVKADQVGRVYAQEIVEDLPAGSWVKTNSGWRQK